MTIVFLGFLLLIQACQTTLGLTDQTQDFSTSGCQNFNFSSMDDAYLPSDVISMSGSCGTTQETKVLCPSWNITPPALVQVKVLRNHTVHDGTMCTRIMEIQVVTFNNTNQRVQLLVEFEHPRSEPIKEINVQRSDDGVYCRQSRDCYYSDQQFCSPSGTCTCSDRWVFIRNVEKCVPGISRVKGQCKYTEQCQIPNSICQYTGCECDRFHAPNFDYKQCIPEGRGYSDSCLTDGNCQLKTNNTVCRNNYCGCRDGYAYDYDTREQGCRINGAAPVKVFFGWWITAFFVIFKVFYCR